MILKHVAQDNPTAAQRLGLHLEQAATLLITQPSLGRPGRVHGTRELIVSGMPYLIPYRVRGRRIEILRIFHTARRWPAQS